MDFSMALTIIFDNFAEMIEIFQQLCYNKY